MTEPLAAVYCKWCNKTHVVRPDEQECGFPGTWSFEGEQWPTDKERSHV